MAVISPARKGNSKDPGGTPLLSAKAAAPTASPLIQF